MKLRRLVSFVVAATVAATGLVVPTVSADADDLPDGPIPPIPGIELVERRTANSKVFTTDEPGRFESKVYTGPVHFRDESGGWAEIDSRLVADVAGRVRNTANSFTLDLGLDQLDLALGRIVLDAEHSIAFAALGALPGTGVLDGNNVTYQGVWPGVDMRLSSQPGGLKEDLILASRAVPDTYLFPLILQGLTASIDEATGDVVFRDSNGVVRIRTPRGWMEDAKVNPQAGEGARSDGVTYELVPLPLGQVILKMRLDRAWLDAPERVFPVTVDPNFHPQNTQSDDTYVQQPYNNNYSGDFQLKAGTFNGGTDKARSMLHFHGLDHLNGKNIESATLWLYNYHSFSCSPRPIRIHRITDNWDANTYRTFPGANFDGGWWVEENFAKGYTGCGPDWQGFNVHTAVHNWTHAVWANQGLLVLSPNEGDSYGWKKFYSWNQGGDAPGQPTPHLDIFWNEPNRAPNVPDLRQPEHNWFGGGAPQLSARLWDPDGNNGNVDFEIAGVVFQPVGTTHGNVAYYTPNLGPGTYSWRVRAWDGQYVSAWSDWWTFTINSPPYIPERLGPGHGWVGTGAPELSARYSDPNGNGGNVDFEIAGVVFQPVPTSQGGTARYTSSVGDGVYSWRVRAWDGQHVSPWSDWWTFTVDGTAPPQPGISAAPHTDQNTWYRDTSTTFSWGTSDTSGISGYSWAGPDTSSSTTPDDTSEGTGTSKAASLAQGTSWFHVKARNGAGLWGPAAHFKVNVDSTVPGTPLTCSSTSSHGLVASADRTVDVSWSAGSDSHSGVAGYATAFIRTGDPGEAGTTVTRSGTTDTSVALADGSWTFHVKTIDRAGNASANRTCGPFVIDGTGPAAPAIGSSTHADGVWDSDRDGLFSWSAPADANGVNGYSVEFSATDTGPDNTAYAAAAGGTWAQNGIADGTWYLRVKAKDTPGNWGSTGRFVVKVDASPPGKPAVNSSTGHTSAAWKKDRTASFDWSGPTELSGISGYSWTVDQNPTTVPDTTPEAGNSTSVTVAGDGTWYLHLRARNGAGIWGAATDVTHHEFKIDTLAPTAPLLVRSTSGHAPSFASSNRDLAMVWNPGADANSGVDGYATAWTNTEAAGAGTTKTTSGLTASKTGTSDGEWWFHVRTVDLAGNASSDVAYGPFFIDPNAPSDPVVLASTLLPEIAAQSDEIGLEQWSPYRSMPLGGNGTGYVNLRSGNLVASFEDASVPGQGLNAVVRHTYNSRRSNPDQHDTGLGLGWSLSVADLEAGLDDVDGAITDLDLLAPITVAVPRIVEGAYTTSGYMLEFTDGDGTTHRFTRNGPAGSRWQSPPGVSLRIREILTNGVVSTYQLIRPDGVIYEAKNLQSPLQLPRSEWKITTVSDRNGNVLTFDYAKVADNARPVAVRHNRPGVNTMVSLAWDTNPQSANYRKLLSITALPDYSAEDPGSGAVTSWVRRTDFGYSGSRLTSMVENAQTDTAGGKRTTTLGYDVEGRLASVTDPRGGITSFTHTTAADGNRLTNITDRRSFPWAYTYGAPGSKDNDANSLTTVTSPTGAVTTYELTPRGQVGGGDQRIAGGNVVRIRDAGHNDPAVPITTRYTWSQNRMTSDTDGAGAVSSYQYNDLGLVTQVTEPATNDPARTDLADIPGAVAGPVVSVIEWSFPDGYRADNCNDPAAGSGPVSKHGYCDAVAEMTRTRFADNHGDAQRRITDFTHGPTGNLLTVTQLASGAGTADATKDRATTFEYYTSGALRSVDGPLPGTADMTVYGTTTDAAYGGYDRTGLPATVKDPLGFTKSFWYTPYGHIGKAEDRDGKLTWSRFDGRDNLIEVVRDDDGDRARDIDLAHPNDLDDISRYEYDANDWKVKATTGRGTRTAPADDYTTISCYDAGGLLLKMSAPGASGAAPLSDPCSTANIGVRLSDRLETLSAFNNDGTKSRDTNPTGGVTEYEYYPNASLKLTRADTAGSTARAETLHLYDGAGRLTVTRLPVVNDAGSRPEEETVYTPAGTVAARKETTSTGGRSLIEHAYNAHGEAVQTRGPRTIDGVKAEERHTINRFGEIGQTDRLVKTIGTPARWITTAFGHDQAGRQTSVTQATGTGGQLTSTYTFDALGQLKEQTADPVNPGHTVTYEYSGEGQQTKRIDKVNGQLERTSVYSYNHDNTQASLIVTDEAGKTLASCNYEAGADPATGYDPDGHLLVSRTVAGTTGCDGGTQLRKHTFTWDGRGYLAGTTQSVRAPSGAEITRDQTFSYTADGDIASATHHGKKTDYAYSPAGWLTSMTDWRNKTTSITYQPSGAPKTQALGGAANGTFTYHPDGSVKDLTWKATGLGTPTVRAHTGLTYDEGGLRTAENVAVAWPFGTFKSTAAHLGTYSYDLLDRLVGWQSPFEEDTTTNQPVTSQTLDDGGNATAETVKAGTATRSSSTSTFPNGRLATKQTTVGTTTSNDTFSYNGLGEEISRVETGGTTTTAYDPMGHSARVDQPGSAADVDYVYDTADRLISRTETVPGGTPQTTLYFYWGAGGSLAEETTATGTTKVRYLVDSDNEAIGQEKVNGTSSTFQWMLPDTAGNPATYTSDSGGVIEQAAFDPYGKPDKGGQGKDLSGGATPTLGFQGAITDKATGNVVLGARLYDPTTARFTTPDTFVAGALDLELGTDSLTGNRYLFAAANPVSFYEDGHWPKIKIKLPNPVKALKKVAKKAVPALGFVPVVGTGIDVISAATGRDLLNGGRKLSGAERALFLGGAAAGLVPGAGTAAKAALKTATKATTKTKAVAKVAGAADALGDVCRVNSFVPGTLVLMADGSSKPIEDIKIGDEVLATDPETGETVAKPVTDLITGHGLKELVEITIDGALVTATARHPFYVKDRGWADAADLRTGDQVRQPSGSWTALAKVRRLDVATATVHNLTVADIHTYYVQAGGQPVLVHNCARSTRSIEQAAKDLVKQNANKNRVSIGTPSGKLDIDLVGRAHAGLPTPHTKFSQKHVKPGDPSIFSYTTKWMRATSWADLRLVRRILKQRSR